MLLTPTTAFVTFENSVAAKIVNSLSTDKVKETLFGDKLILDKAANPSDILWENYEVNELKKAINIVFISVGVFIIFFGLGSYIYKIKEIS